MNSICIFGDSVAKGVVFDGVVKKYILLKDCCANLIHSTAGFAVKNYSKFGATVTKGLETMRKHTDELSRYDYVALEFGGNDCDFNWAQVAQEPQADHQPNTPMTLFLQRYRELVREIRKAGGHPVMVSLPPIDAKRYFEWISRGLNGSNILKWLGDVEHIYRWHEMYNLAVCRLAAEMEVPFVDVSSAFLAMRNYQELICEDGIHPNAKGQQLLCNIIRNTLQEVSPCAC